MIFPWLIVWLIAGTPDLIFSPAWNAWAITFVIALILA